MPQVSNGIIVEFMLSLRHRSVKCNAILINRHSHCCLFLTSLCFPWKFFPVRRVSTKRARHEWAFTARTKRPMRTGAATCMSVSPLRMYSNTTAEETLARLHKSKVQLTTVNTVQLTCPSVNRPLLRRRAVFTYVSKDHSFT